jgi:hypothetical protein
MEDGGEGKIVIAGFHINAILWMGDWIPSPRICVVDHAAAQARLKLLDLSDVRIESPVMIDVGVIIQLPSNNILEHVRRISRATGRTT